MAHFHEVRKASRAGKLRLDLPPLDWPVTPKAAALGAAVESTTPSRPTAAECFVKGVVLFIFEDIVIVSVSAPILSMNQESNDAHTA